MATPPGRGLVEELHRCQTAIQLLQAEVLHLNEALDDLKDVVQHGNGLPDRLTRLEGELRAVQYQLSADVDSLRIRSKDSQELLRGTSTSTSIMARMIQMEDAVADLHRHVAASEKRIETGKKLMWAILIATVGGILSAVWDLIKMAYQH